jgi:IS5 family transposase
MSVLVFDPADRFKNNTLIRIADLIDWESLRDRMGDLGRSGYGPKAYDPVKMLKALILQAWHSLSDVGLEEALRVRMDFIVITGLMDDVPDETTICRFRGLLVKRGLLDELLLDINRQLESRGLKVKESKGAILDATIIASSARPRKELEAIAVDREEEQTTYEVKEPHYFSKDPDATWLKKGKRSYFGYKGFAAVDCEPEDGFIECVHVTPAHVSEVKEFSVILPKLNLQGRLYADKGYASKENKELLKKRWIKNGIMEKANRNQPLTSWQKRFNRMISKVRYKVEQGFGTLKRKFRFDRASYKTTVKVHAQMVLKAISFNLLKALNKIVKPTITPLFCQK